MVGALLGVERRRRALLPHLLVATLQRAVALAEMDRIAQPVAEDLDLDVARLLEIFLDIDRVVAEGGLGLGPGGAERVRQVGLGAGHLHAASAAAGCRLDDDRVADLAADALRRVVIGDAALGSRHAGDAQRLGGPLGFDLVAHGADMLGLGADEGDVVILQDLGEAGVLGEKAVAGMDGIGAGDLAGGEQRRNVKIAVARRRRPDADALVGEAHMHGVGIRRGMDRHGGDAEFLGGAQHAERDLAAIGDQDLVEHALDHSITISGCPYSTGWPSSTSTAETVPARGATISLKVFMASTSRIFSPALTVLPTSTKALASGLERR